MGPDIWECILRLTLSALFGGIVGLEREIRLKGAGIRTHLIVSLASCMMMLVSKYGFYDMLEFAAANSYDSMKLDPSRISAGLVTAIGFLGAGAIFSRNGVVTGLTTAAGLWATVGIGMTVGAGMYPISVFCTVFIVTIQAVLYWDHTMLGRARTSAQLNIRIYDQPEALDQLQSELAGLKLVPARSKYERIGGVLSIELQLDHLPCSHQKLGALLSPIVKQPYIISILW